MCFSAEVSFGAGAVLSAVGIAAVAKSSTSAQIVFASIPLIFAVQQITEGFVWLSLVNSSFASWHQLSIHIFLIFAQIVWPSWVPFSIFLLENEPQRKKVLASLTAFGMLISCLLAFRLFTHTVSASASGKHVFYDFGLSSLVVNFMGIFYLVVTVIPPFLSSVRKMWMLGFSILFSYVITELFFKNYVISVWCFFAALISGSILFILTDLRKTFIERRVEP